MKKDPKKLHIPKPPVRKTAAPPEKTIPDKRKERELRVSREKVRPEDEEFGSES